MPIYNSTFICTCISQFKVWNLLFVNYHILLVIKTRCATYPSGSINDSLLTKLQFELTTPFQTLRKLDLIALILGVNICKKEA